MSMQFDTILKSLFQNSHALESILKAPVREWINVEVPAPHMSKLDLVAWLSDGRLFHLELQSGNDSDMPRRMLEYYVLLWKRYGVRPDQHLIYVGRRRLSMAGDIQHERLIFSYRLIDMLDLDFEALVASPAIEDSLLAILCRLKDKQQAVRRILA